MALLLSLLILLTWITPSQAVVWIDGDGDGNFESTHLEDLHWYFASGNCYGYPPYQTTRQEPCAQIDTSTDRAFSGSRSIKESYLNPGVAELYDQGITYKRNGPGTVWPTNGTTHWFVRIYSFTEPGFTYNANNSKLFYMKNSVGVAPTYVLEHVWGDRKPVINVQGWADVCPTSGSENAACIFYANKASIPMNNNQWYCLEFEVDQGTPGQYNGAIRMWIDGVLTTEYTGNRHVFATNTIVQGFNTNGPAARQDTFQIFKQQASGIRYLDKVALADTRIGCSGTPPPPGDTTPPSAPSGLTTNPGTNQIALAWTNGTDSVDSNLNARIERCTVSSADPCTTGFSLIATQGAVGGAGSTYTSVGLASNTRYCYRINNQDSSGNQGSYSATACGTTSTVSQTQNNRTLMVNEAFTRSDNTDLGGEWTDSYASRGPLQIVSGSIRSTTVGTEGMERFAGLSGGLPDSQWSQVSITAMSASNAVAGALLMNWAAAPTVQGYQCAFRRTSSVLTSGIRRYDAGSPTTLTSTLATVWSAGDVVRCERQGSDIRMYKNDVLLHSATDSTYTSGHVGVMATGNVAVADLQLDNFKAGGFTTTTQSANFVTLGSDSFTRADNTDLGASWDDSYTSQNNGQIVGNRFRATALNSAEPKAMESYNAVTPPNDQWCQVTLSTFTGSSDKEYGCMLRMPNSPSLAQYFCYARQNNIVASTIGKWYTSGVGDANLAHDYTVQWGAGDKLRCAAEGSLVTLYRTPASTGVEEKVLDVVDSAITSGKAGIFGWMQTTGALADAELDDFAMGGFSGNSSSTLPAIISAVCDTTGCTLGYGATTPLYIRVLVGSNANAQPISEVTYPIASFPSGRYTHPQGFWAAGTNYVCFFGQDANHTESTDSADYRCVNVTSLVQTDTTAPVLTAGIPNGQTLASGTTSTVISFDSDEPASVRFGTADEPYSALNLGAMTTTDNLHFTATVTGLSDGATFTYYACGRDLVEVPNTCSTRTLLSFSVAAAPGDATAPSTIADLSCIGFSSSQAQCSFTAPTDDTAVTSIRVTIGTDVSGTCTPDTLATVAWGTVSPQFLSGLLANTSYCLTAQAVDAAGNIAAASNTATVTTLAVTDPVPPTRVMGCVVTTTTTFSLVITCDPAKDSFGIDHYAFEVCAGIACLDFEALGSSTGPTITHSGLAAGQTWTYRVIAIDRNGNVSAAYSSPVTATTSATGWTMTPGICPCNGRRVQ